VLVRQAEVDVRAVGHRGQGRGPALLQREVAGDLGVGCVEIHLGFGPARESPVTPADLDVAGNDAFGPGVALADDGAV